jgi:hypothetical protein
MKLSTGIIMGRSVEAWKAAQEEEQRQSIDLYARLQRLNEIQAEFQRLRDAHVQLAADLQAFGQSLGFLGGSDEKDAPHAP